MKQESKALRGDLQAQMGLDSSPRADANCMKINRSGLNVLLFNASPNLCSEIQREGSSRDRSLIRGHLIGRINVKMKVWRKRTVIRCQEFY